MQHWVGGSGVKIKLALTFVTNRELVAYRLRTFTLLSNTYLNIFKIFSNSNETSDLINSKNRIVDDL